MNKIKLFFKTLYPWIMQLITFGLLLNCGKNIEENENQKKTITNIISNTENQSDEEVLNNEKNLEIEALYNAIIADDLNLVSSAIHQNDSLDFLFNTGESPLTLAIKKAKNEIVSLIIEHTKDYNIKNQEGFTPIHLAVIKRNFLALNNLIKMNAEINIPDKLKRYPLDYALSEGGERFAITLLTYGANFKNHEKIKNEYLIARFENLNFQKSIELINLISSHEKINDENLLKAISTGNTYFLNYLLLNYEKYREIIRQTNTLNTAIDIIDTQERNDMVDKLLSWGANPNLEDQTPPLIYAVKKNYINVIESLIIYDTNITIVDFDQLNALDHAVKRLNYPAIELIIGSIKRSFNVIPDEKKHIYTKIFEEACHHIPSVEHGLNYTYTQYIRLRNKISSMLKCATY